mmetsp:Transcript_14190/g.27212  ORF Transcript_14190/g.27212 Transcript_14190/m.27212 type:complete len:423 (+) Transcript_14190:164-1432(+)
MAERGGQPPAKMKRTAERQLTQDDPPSDQEEEGEQQGTFARADPAVLATRRFVKPKRPNADNPNPSPFARVSLVTKTQEAERAAPAAATSAPEPAGEGGGDHCPDAAAGKEEGVPSGETDDKTDPPAQPDASTDAGSPAPAPKVLGLGLGSGASGPQGFALAAAGQGGFGSASSAGNGANLLSAAAPFSFGSSGAGFPSLQSVFGGGASGTPVSLFGADKDTSAPASATSTSAAAPPKALVKMSDEPTKTGEEEEEVLFNETAQLFEYEKGPAQSESANKDASSVPAGQAGWKAGKRGSLRINRNTTTRKARLVMKGHNNLHLLLNASLWSGMTFTPMEGTKHGVTFACINHNKAAPPEGPGEDLTTYAVRFNSKAKNADEQLEQFLAKTKECMEEGDLNLKPAAQPEAPNPSPAKPCEEAV